MDIEARVSEKLNKYNLGNLKDFDDKTIKRLYEIEKFLYNMEVDAKEIEEKLKGLKPNITNITILTNENSTLRDIITEKEQKIKGSKRRGNVVSI